MKAGLTPARVLRAATLDSATFFSEDRERGLVSVGKAADLVLLDAAHLLGSAT